MSKVEDNLKYVQSRIDFASNNTASKEKVRLVAVSKTVDWQVAMQAYNAGQRDFGENRLPVLSDKVANMPDDVEWHFIGHLQSNKVRPVVEVCSWIHSVDSIKLLEKIDRIAGEIENKPKVLLEVNVSQEDSKYGLSAADVPAIIEHALDLKNIDLRGLMCMAPFGAPEEELLAIFTSLNKLKDQLNKTFDIELSELSMGMSNDFEQAIAAGSTMVRVGSSIFK
jgi:pyridoxal phosphate enzyme (YggS family)